MLHLLHLQVRNDYSRSVLKGSTADLADTVELQNGCACALLSCLSYPNSALNPIRDPRTQCRASRARPRLKARVAAASAMLLPPLYRVLFSA